MFQHLTQWWEPFKANSTLVRHCMESFLGNPHCATCSHVVTCLTGQYVQVLREHDTGGPCDNLLELAVCYTSFDNTVYIYWVIIGKHRFIFPSHNIKAYVVRSQTPLQRIMGLLKFCFKFRLNHKFDNEDFMNITYVLW